MAENEASTEKPQASSAAPAEAAGESKPPNADTAKSSGAPVRPASSPPQSRPSSGYGGGPPRGGGGRPDRRGGGGGGGRRFFRRRKVDFFSVNKIDDINYKEADTLRQFIGDRGKILPRRHTGLSAQHQRLLKRAIKRARNIALLPFAGPGKPGGSGGGRSGYRPSSRQE